MHFVWVQFPKILAALLLGGFLVSCSEPYFQSRVSKDKNQGIPIVVPVNPVEGGGGPTINPPTQVTGIDPSNGSGGKLQPGQSENTAGGGTIYSPQSYSPDFASPVVVLFNMDTSQWKSIADRDGFFVVDTNSYNDQRLIFNRLNEAVGILEAGYNVDRARIYFAGWSAGGNIALLNGTNPVNANELAGIMVFPGSGGNYARNYLTQASQQGKRAVPIYYAVGDRDTSTGYYPGVVNEAQILSQIPGYAERITYKVWPEVGHSLHQGAFDEAWKWISQYNSKTN
ncbi:MAG: hypothetical protein KDD68_11215 [Bdellovibrionales bacterium]|nr:hypothetical protein [Bdellovibrionales bacterium]